MSYIIKKDQFGDDRIIRTQKPVFIGTIADAYKIDERRTSPVFNGKKILIDEVLDDVPASKLNWAFTKGLRKVAAQKDPQIIKDQAQRAFDFIKAKRHFLNITAIEEQCGIKRTGLLNAINRDQKSFGGSTELLQFLEDNFEGWDL